MRSLRTEWKILQLRNQWNHLYPFLRCGSALNELSGECPPDGPGIFPNCICIGGKSFDPEKNSCATVNKSVCPKGATG